ncbi:MFS transporter [Kocuria palustris]|nr:MFS transporter [Kocuria palustris]
MAQGFSDAAPGALLPTMENHYGISYAVVLMIWIANAIGFIPVAMSFHKVEPIIGSSRSLTMCCLCLSIMYAIVLLGTIFPVVCVGFFFGGIGAAIGNTYTNIFLSRLDKQLKFLGTHHGFYGIGATISPIIATSVLKVGFKWNYFYFILLGMAIFNSVNTYIAFRGCETDLALWIEATRSDESQAVFRDAFKTKTTWLLAFFLFFYKGLEVSMAGWIVTYCINYRHGNPATMGYIASGFWAGLTIGRMLLTRPLHRFVGVHHGVVLVLAIAIVLVLLQWILSNVYAIAVLAAFLGIFIGPNYPLMVTYTSFNGAIPRKIHFVSMTLMTTLGLSGGAFFPFMVGLITQSAGSYVVLPVFIGLYSAMVGIWLTLPNLEKARTR